MSKMSTFINRIGLIAALSCIIIIVLTAPSSASEALDGLKNLIHGVLPAEKVAIYAISLDGKKPIIDINSDTLMPPASCVKMVTAAAALSELGVDYRFRTEFLSETKPNGISIGTLYIKGNGDPFITPEVLWSMMRAVTNHGIYRINDDIVIDDSFFAGHDYPHKDSGDYRAFEALTSAVSANFNVVEFIVSPGHAAGAPASVEVDPPAPYIKVVNKVKTGSRVRVYANRDVTDDQEIFTLHGETALGYKPTTLARSIKHPIKYAGSLFSQLLKQNGVEFSGEVKQGKTPERAYRLFDEPSRPLALLVRDMNKFSSNFIAEQLVKHLAVKRSEKPGTTAQGLVAIREWLKGIGIDRKDYVLENGSGLSGKSLMTAEQLVTVLKSAAKDIRIGPDFLSSLSILGVDGTMRHWHGARKLRGILRAKTGTLKGASTLAGFVPDKDGRLIAFAIMSKGLKIGINETRENQLKIVEKISSLSDNAARESSHRNTTKH
jgi:D-alanyl-D-alanine carboxypeptidase/D-alanyl-D-alanine-endopeptidase (penicillin-binding protein 4)